MEVLNLDKYLRAQQSLAAQGSDFIDGPTFDIDNDRNIITNTKFKNISFSKAQGGTAILGGEDDGDGVLQIKNAAGSVIVQGDSEGISVKNTAGSTIVQLDSDGITVNDGKITVANSSGSTVLDAGGLVSTNNFVTTTNIVQSTQTTTSTSYIPLTNGTLPSIVLARSAVLLVYVSYDAYNVGFIFDGYGGNFRMYDVTNGAEVSFTTSTFRGIFSPDETFSSIQVAPQRVSGVVPVTAGAGTTTFRAEYRAKDGGTAVIEEFVVGFLQLGN